MSTSAQAGDWMAFGGAMLGAIITVAGAIIVVEWQADAQARRFQMALASILEDAQRHIAGCEAPTIAEGQAPATLQESHAEFAMKMINVAKAMASQRVPDTPELARAYMLINEMDIDVQGLHDELRPARVYGGVTDVSDRLRLTKAAVTSALAQLRT